MTAPTSPRAVRLDLESGALAPGDAVATLAGLARSAPVRTARLEACSTLGDIAGRAFSADWDTAERAAFELLALARQADAVSDRRGVVSAMGRAFRNIWLLPFVHRRLSDDDPRVVVDSILAAGGLGFPALEETLTTFLADGAAPEFRRAAIRALGRLGAMSAVDRLLECFDRDPDDGATVLDALAEIRSPAALDRAVSCLNESDPDRLIASVGYLAELGSPEVLPTIRRLMRDDDVRLRQLARSSALALAAEQDDPGNRFLAAMTDPDRSVRAIKARRLRSVPMEQVLEHAEMLLEDDAPGVVQVLGEIREPEVTRYLLAIAGREDLDLLVRARAVGSIEANQSWERDELSALAHDEKLDASVREAAIQALGAFTNTRELFERLGPLAAHSNPRMRAAFLWAMQLAVSPGTLTDEYRGTITDALSALVTDSDAFVRRRAAYVIGNLEIHELATKLVELAGDKDPDLRLAALVGLAELGSPAVFDAVVRIARSEADPQALAAASRALASARDHEQVDLSSAGQIAGKIEHSLGDRDPLIREAAARLASLCPSRVPVSSLVPLVTDQVPAVRAEALTAIGHYGAGAGKEGCAALIAAFEDPDPALHERAAEALLAVGGRTALAQVLAFAASEASAEARAHVVDRMDVPPDDLEFFLPKVDEALGTVGPHDDAYESLLGLKVRLLETHRTADQTMPEDIDRSIVRAFPSFEHMAKLPGFEPLMRSLRTAESLYRGATGQSDVDFSPPIVLWMKVLENYVHTWLGARMSHLQREPRALFAHVDQLMAGAWPSYQRFVRKQWTNPVTMGSAIVELPVRSLPNALRDLQDGRRKRLNSPLSITEWARLWVFFAVDHPSGIVNLFKVPVASAESSLHIAHTLHSLAAVRNLVTHRTSASAETVRLFRRDYYGTFESLAKMA